jgi:hypothetical protein
MREAPTARDDESAGARGNFRSGDREPAACLVGVEAHPSAGCIRFLTGRRVLPGGARV